jgi:hypothetical protein
MIKLDFVIFQSISKNEVFGWLVPAIKRRLDSPIIYNPVTIPKYRKTLPVSRVIADKNLILEAFLAASIDYEMVWLRRAWNQFEKQTV